MKEVVEELKKYFKIQELVCPDVYKRFGEQAWYFFDESLLRTILWLRKTINVPITINNWVNGGNFSQRGLRCNTCEMVKSKTRPYLSAHILGKGVDLDVKGYTAQQTRDFIIEHAATLPCKIRLEKDVNWVHLDVRNFGNAKIQLF